MNPLMISWSDLVTCPNCERRGCVWCNFFGRVPNHVAMTFRALVQSTMNDLRIDTHIIDQHPDTTILDK